MTLKLGMQHLVLKYYQVCSNDDTGFTLTCYLVPYAFVWEKGKTMDFSGTIVIYDLKLATDDRSDKKALYTCIKSRKMYKIRLLRHFFETCNK